MLQEHLGYVSDATRLRQYTEAIRRTIKPGDHVMDLGCGTGVLGLLCLRSGAARVYAVDETAMIEVARGTLERAGLGDKAVFIRGKSRRIDLPEQVDAIVCDQVGYFGFDAGIVPDLADARRRFLKPGGALIPAAITLYAAGVESEDAYAPVAGWGAEPVPSEMRWLREQAVNTRYPVNLRAAALLTASSLLGTMNLREDHDGLTSWTADLHVTRDGILHGIAGWFDGELAAGVCMTNAPLAMQPIARAQAFLPIGEAARVRAGDRVGVTVMARPADDLMAWVVELPTGRRLRHSTWNGMLLAPADLLLADPSRVPRPNRMAVARAIVLGYCDGLRTTREIEAAVLRDHPALFPSAEEISRVVALVLARETE